MSILFIDQIEEILFNNLKVSNNTLKVTKMVESDVGFNSKAISLVKISGSTNIFVKNSYFGNNILQHGTFFSFFFPYCFSSTIL